MSTMGQMALMAGDVEKTVKENGDTTTVARMTTEEATAWVKAAPRGTRFYVHVSQDAPVAGEDEMVYRDGVRGSLRLSGHDMLDFLKDGLPQVLQDKGARWRCTASVYGKGARRSVYYWVG